MFETINICTVCYCHQLLTYTFGSVTRNMSLPPQQDYAILLGPAQSLVNQLLEIRADPLPRHPSSGTCGDQLVFIQWADPDKISSLFNPQQFSLNGRGIYAL